MIVLLHGVGLDHTIWDDVVPLLPGRTHAPDLPGHAGHRLDGPVTLADLVPPLSEPAHLVGFSLGALVAIRLAADRPELARSLTLVSAVAGRTMDERAAVRERLVLAERDLPASFEAAIVRWGERFRARVAPVLARNDPASYRACYQVFAEADDEVAALYGRLSMPVLAITGADDPGSTPAMTQAIAAAVPDGEAQVVAGARHLLPLEAPDALASAIIQTMRRAS